MIEICALASGSNGNCYYIGNKDSAVLIDVGINYRRIVERFSATNLRIEKVKAAFISHEHYDHIIGMRVLSKKRQITGIFSKKTYNKVQSNSKPELYAIFETNKSYKIDGINVIPFAKQHNAVDPHSFIVEIEGKTIGVMTDIGVITEEIGEQIAKCDALFLEANYDGKMLWEGKYPYYLKQRVSSDIGHLSNEQAKNAVLKYGSDKLQYIFLSHISAENNTLELAYKTFSDIAKTKKIILTSRQRATEVIMFN